MRFRFSMRKSKTLLLEHSMGPLQQISKLVTYSFEKSFLGQVSNDITMAIAIAVLYYYRGKVGKWKSDLNFCLV